MADRSTRRAALVATVVAIPVAVIVALVSFNALSSTSSPAATSSPSPHATATAAVAMPAPRLMPAHAQACLAFIAQLPNQLRNLPQRHVSAGPEQNAAFGDPPITVQCGAPEVHPSPTETIYPISGVCWAASPGKSATVWTTLDREVPVAVSIPNTYQSSGQWAAEFSAPLVNAMPSIKTPYNC
jgi:hypothetical protein